MTLDFAWPPTATSLPQVVTGDAIHMLAPNATEWTWEGTNTWIVGAKGGTECVVVDPGTRDDQHGEAIIEAARQYGWTITGIVVTHDHDDHAPGSEELRRATGAEVIANAPLLYDDRTAPQIKVDRVVADGDRLEVGPLTLEVFHTPGHSDDSLTFWLPDERSLLTGDTILGRRASAIFGDLGDFLTSCERLLTLAREGRTVLLPGHGTPLDDTEAVIEKAVSARQKRLAEVRGLVDEGITDVATLTDRMYPGLDGTKRHAAEAAVRSTRNYVTGWKPRVHQHSDIEAGTD